MKRVAVFGLALTGTAVARVLTERGIDVVLGDDRITDAHIDLARELNSELCDFSDDSAVDRLLDGVDTLLPAPGVPPHHQVIVAAEKRAIRIRSEIDVAYEWEQERAGGPRPLLGVTGTDGKTTTTMIAAHLLRTAGMKTAEVGNTDLPFMAAIDDSYDAFVVECSSFRLQYLSQFRCDASVWLNIAPDHLDWHPNFEHYVEAKKSLWKFSRASDVAIAPYGNDVIVSAAQSCGARVVTFGGTAGDYRVVNHELVSPSGSMMSVDSLWRSMPHDVTNSLAAAALVLETQLCSPSQAAQGLQSFESAHHRIEFVGEFDGVRWFNDSKATSPHAALTAIRAFDRLVLIAGGRNKDLDLRQMATEPQRMEGVVAIGDDAELIESAFHGVCPVVRAGSMDEAVRSAHQMVSRGNAVVLSPGCTSYDWYKNYGERGDDFMRAVRSYFAEKGIVK
jgi:UDP-N-acetylmuramoylalanine--D-glutamate ligase